MSIKEMRGEADATKEAGMIEMTKNSTLRTMKDTSVVKKYIRRLIAQRLKKIKTMMKIAQGVPVIEQLRRS